MLVTASSLPRVTTDRAPRIPARADRRTLGGFMAVRLITNTYLRFPYVFIDAIAKGLGVPLTTVTTVLGLRELGGIVGPTVGRAVDGGRLRGGLVWSGVVTGLACTAGVLFDSLWWFTALMILGGAARVGVDLSQNVWIGRKVPLKDAAGWSAWSSSPGPAPSSSVPPYSAGSSREPDGARRLRGDGPRARGHHARHRRGPPTGGHPRRQRGHRGGAARGGVLTRHRRPRPPAAAPYGAMGDPVLQRLPARRADGRLRGERRLVRRSARNDARHHRRRHPGAGGRRADRHVTGRRGDRPHRRRPIRGHRYGGGRAAHGCPGRRSRSHRGREWPFWRR